MTRGVDDVDVGVAVPDRAILGEDRDPALPLEIVGVHHALGDVLVLRERAGLHEQLVDERRLAVIDVGDDRDVAQGFGRRGHGGGLEGGARSGVSVRARSGKPLIIARLARILRHNLFAKSET